MGLTLAEKEENRDAAKTAYKAALGGKSYSINPGGGTGRSVSRQEVKTLRDEYLYWQQQVDKDNAGAKGIPTKFITSND